MCEKIVCWSNPNCTYEFSTPAVFWMVVTSFPVGCFLFSKSIDPIQSRKSPQELLVHCYIDYFESPCGLRVEPDILVSNHVSDPGSCPHFQKPENILVGLHKCVIDTRLSATTFRTLYFHASG